MVVESVRRGLLCTDAAVVLAFAGDTINFVRQVCIHSDADPLPNPCAYAKKCFNAPPFCPYVKVNLTIYDVLRLIICLYFAFCFKSNLFFCF